MNWRRKHRSCLCEVLLLRILKQQKTLTVLQKHSLTNQTRTEKQKNVHNGKKTNGKLQQKENYNGEPTLPTTSQCTAVHNFKFSTLTRENY